jgi:hypothetical protein
VRWSLSVAGIALIILLSYLGIASPAPGESTYLGLGRHYASDDLSKISRALDRQRIPYRIDDQRRIAVPSLKREAAEELVAKLEIGPRLPGELRDQLTSSSPWESLHEKELREHQERARILEAMISDLPGIVGSFVWINRPKARLGLQPPGKPSGFVRLETEGDRQLPFRTVQSITTILTGYEPGLTADAVTVLDRRGHKYLDAGNPELSALSSNRAREEELSQEILEELDWIKGVRVSVQLPGVTGESLGLAASPLSMGVKPSESASRPGAPATAEAPSRTAVTLNRTLSLETDPPATAEGVRSSRLAEAVATTGAAAETSSARGPAEPGRIWVKVPRSYYYQVSLLPGHKEPSQDDLKKLVARTEEQIRTGVGLVVPLSGPASWKTTIDMIQDEIPLSQPPVVAASSGRRRPALDWGIAGALGAMAAALVTIGSWALGARRPGRRSESAPSGMRFDGGTSSMPGPSERVREFVRRNPEAAVSVLERWTSQGGAPS